MSHKKPEAVENHDTNEESGEKMRRWENLSSSTKDWKTFPTLHCLNALSNCSFTYFVHTEYSSVEQEKQHQEDQMAINDDTIPSTDNNYIYSSLNNWISHILIKFKLKYNCSNGLVTLLIAIIINFLFLYN